MHFNANLVHRFKPIIILTLCFLLSTLTLTFANEYQNDEDSKTTQKFNEQFVDNLIGEVTDPDVVKHMQNLKQVLFEPATLVEGLQKEYDETDMETLMLKYSNSKSYKDFTTIYSVSDTLEFLINFYNRALYLEKQYDDLLQNDHLLESHSNYLENLKIKASEVDQLMPRVNSFFKNFQKSGNFELKEELMQFFSINDKLYKRTAEDKALKKEMDAFFEKGIAISQFSEMYGEMVKSLLKHVTGFIDETNVEVATEEIPEFGYAAKPVDFDIIVLEDLLRLYQTQEGLLNNFKSKTNADKHQWALELKDIAHLKIQTDEYIEENQNQITLFLSSLLQTFTRIAQKQLMAFDLTNKLTAQRMESFKLTEKQMQFTQQLNNAGELWVNKNKNRKEL